MVWHALTRIPTSIAAMVLVGALSGSITMTETVRRDSLRTEAEITINLRAYEWRPVSADVVAGFAVLRQRGYDGVIVEVGGVVDAMESRTPEGAVAQWRVNTEALVDAAHANGLAVHAVSGDPGWVQPDRAYAAPMLARAIAEWNATEPPERRFASLQLDIEPPQDHTYRQGVQRLLALLADVTAVPGVPPLEVAVPARIAEVEVDDRGLTGAAALGALARRTGLTVEIMAYRDHADGADGTLELVDRVRRQLGPEVLVRVAQEVGPSRGESARITHEGKGRISLVRSLSAIERRYAGDAAVVGVDVHDSVGALALR